MFANWVTDHEVIQSFFKPVKDLLHAWKHTGKNHQEGRETIVTITVDKRVLDKLVEVLEYAEHGARN